MKIRKGNDYSFGKAIQEMRLERSLHCLCYKEPEELYHCISDLEEAEDFLLKEGYLDVAKDVRRLIEYINSSKNRIEVLQENLKDVFKAVDWCMSGDYGKERVKDAVERYRKK